MQGFRIGAIEMGPSIRSVQHAAPPLGMPNPKVTSPAMRRTILVNSRFWQAEEFLATGSRGPEYIFVVTCRLKR
jgi:hypothetical protein